MRASDALPFSSTRRLTLLLVRPFAPCWQLLRPLLTSRSGSTPSPFQAQGEISPGKNAPLHRTTAAFTPLRLGHESFAASCPLALLGSALYPVLVHRLAVYAPRFLPTVGHPSAVALRFVRCGQLTGGLAPPGVRPCRAHKKSAAWAALITTKGGWRSPLNPGGGPEFSMWLVSNIRLLMSSGTWSQNGDSGPNPTNGRQTGDAGGFGAPGDGLSPPLHSETRQRGICSLSVVRCPLSVVRCEWWLRLLTTYN